MKVSSYDGVLGRERGIWVMLYSTLCSENYFMCSFLPGYVNAPGSRVLADSGFLHCAILFFLPIQLSIRLFWIVHVWLNAVSFNGDNYVVDEWF